MLFERSDLFLMPDGIQTRWASAENPTGQKGGACRDNDGRKRAPSIHPLKAGASLTLAETTGASGVIRRIWATISDRSPAMLRGLRIDMYWDGARTPAITAPWGDFFCNALGRLTPFQNAFFANPEGRSFNCYIPMPFRTGMKIVVTNETDIDLGDFYYEVDYTVGDRHGPDVLFFHAHWRRENPTTLLKDFEILPRVSGRGRFLGCNIGVIAKTGIYSNSWWGEGEVKIHLDGDTDHPTLCGTGTEDYIGSGWGQGHYANLYQGCPLADNEKLQFGFYRLHVPDPVFFYKDICVTIQQIGCWNPDTIAQMHGWGHQLYHGDKPIAMGPEATARSHGLFERQDDWSSCAYFYLNQTESPLPALAPPQARIEGLSAT